jgi:hypothetical protein
MGAGNGLHIRDMHTEEGKNEVVDMLWEVDAPLPASSFFFARPRASSFFFARPPASSSLAFLLSYGIDIYIELQIFQLFEFRGGNNIKVKLIIPFANICPVMES